MKNTEEKEEKKEEDYTEEELLALMELSKPEPRTCPPNCGMFICNDGYGCMGIHRN